MSRLFYRQSAGYDWNKALPVGNGRLGAMVFGNPECEHLQLNEDSLWYGGPMERVNQDASVHLQEVRELIRKGRISEAEELLLHSFSATPQSCRTYSTLGDLYINYLHINGNYTDYERELDLEDGIFRLRKKNGNVTYREEIFANAPSNLLVIRLFTDENEPFDVDVNFGRMTFYDSAFHDENTVYSFGSMVGEDYRYAAGLSYVNDGGTVECIGEYLVCRAVNSIVLLFTAATTFREPDPLSYVRYTLSDGRAHTYSELFSEHRNDYHSLYDNTKLKLAYDPELDELPTDERLRLFQKEQPDNGLLTTYFDFGRYLMISSSRENSLPANLQGIWNGSINPPWGSKFTININLQMNYWPAEKLGLGSCHLPLFDLMERMSMNGNRVARKMYDCRGTVAHHNTDMWGDCAPQDGWIPATYWVMGMAWLCTHVWEHYNYTKDIEFLSRMYPVMRETVLFFHDFLEEEENSVFLCPSLSPENTYVLPNGESGHLCYNSTMDIEILRDLFTQYLKAAELLEDVDDEFIATTERLLSKLPPIKVGQYGQVMEWPEDYEETEPGHRHISHLYALYPSHQISMEDEDRSLIEAAKVTLQRRLGHGGGHTGWSRAWIMNMYARLYDGDSFMHHFSELLHRSTLDNLFDNHPPFQIDGNFGAVSAIAEALLQSDDGIAVLLPALPKEWQEGSIEGIHAFGGAVYNLYFSNGGLTSFRVKAIADGYRAKVLYKEQQWDISLNCNESREIRLS